MRCRRRGDDRVIDRANDIVDGCEGVHAEIVGTQRRKVFAVASARLNSESGPIAIEARAIFIQVSV